MASRRESAGLLAALALFVVATMLLAYPDTWVPRRTFVLDQTEIGENEKAYPSMEQDWVEDAYKQAKEFRDPGHISREEIRLEAALRESGSIDRNKDWSFQQPLWGKYHQVMSDPSQVRTGWTGGRRIEKHSDPLQHAMEQYAYGAEGHREPEEEWAPAAAEDDINLSDEEKEKRDRMARGTWEYPLSEDKGYLFLQKEVASLRGDIKNLLTQTQSKSSASSGNSIRQQLTYRVLKDELVHARLKAQVAEEKETKEEESEEDKIRHAKREEDKMLDEMHSEVKRLRHKVHRMSSKRAQEERRKHMSAEQAQKDLSDYFNKLNTYTTSKEMSRYETKLAKLRSMVAKAKAAAPQLAQRNIKVEASPQAARAVSARGLQGAKKLAAAAGTQKLESVPAPSRSHGDDLQHLVKSLLPNKSPFLPL